ncbi:MAG: c-type cytochrome [Pseudomonadota bacterium]|jgi:cytochrome c
MKRTLHSLALAAMLAAGSTPFAFAQDAGKGKELMSRSGCLGCHANDKKVVGPGYLEIATKYRGVKGAEDKLVAHIIQGGAGVWGPIPMPPHKHIAEADVRAMVRYVLSLK